ncbi:YopR/YscH family type III secretion effector [Shewanella sp. SR44-3]|uniref:YopR/YscH family type III secretion effector n=1 Tax=unclassified Shewanella TaxID=196818 RepID=UPI0015FA52BC|nr:YopR/YscH family type III secretion effector [Shewanella sp. SR44-3]MBB1269005.1 hypothetical protein [Shewanella sp. SR44-3]
MIELNQTVNQDVYTANLSRQRVVPLAEQQTLEMSISRGQGRGVPDNDVRTSTTSNTAAKPGVDPVLDGFYQRISAMDKVTSTQIKAELSSAFHGDKSAANQALWFAFNQANSSGKRALATQLKQLVSDDFMGRLITETPTSAAELKAILKEEFQFVSRRETALWQAWSQLKADPDKSALVELIRDELGHLIQLNSLMRNMMTNTTRPDLF